MFPASMWERRVWREGPHHWSDPLIIWYIVYRVNAGREVTVARGITKHATPGEIYRKIRQARAAMLPLVQVLAAGSQPTKFTDRPPDDNYSRFVDPLSACVESYVERRRLFRFHRLFGFFEAEDATEDAWSYGRDGSHGPRGSRDTRRFASGLDDPKMEERGLIASPFTAGVSIFPRRVHFSNLRLIYEIRG